MDIWIKSSEVVNGARRVRSEKLREHQNMEGYARCLESKSRIGYRWIYSPNVGASEISNL